MALLTRRLVQQLVDETNISPAALALIVKRLNGTVRDALAAEWELILLSALSRVGVIEYEPKLGGSSKLDFIFQDAIGLRIAGDISCISDDELERINPVDHFSRELIKRTQAHDLGGSMTVRIDAERPAIGLRAQNVRLRLPSPHLFRQYIFNSDFDHFLDRVRMSPGEPHSYNASNSHAGVHISYYPSKSRHLTLNFINYTSQRDLVRNSLYNRLKKKTDQINASGHVAGDGFRGVLLCDGGAALFGPSVGIDEVGRNKIAHHFLRRTLSIDFIAFITITQSDTNGAPERYAYGVEAISRDSAVGAMLGRLLEEGLRHIPQPARTAINARNHSAWLQQHGLGTIANGDHIRSSLASQELKISSRAVFDYLTGRIDPEWFQRLADSWFLSTLRRDLDSGSVVENVEFRQRPDRDDDELIIRWSKPDAAAGAYRLPTDA